MTAPIRMRVPRRRTVTPFVWIERALFSAGLLLAIWCGVVLMDAEYVRRMPIPDPVRAPTPASVIAAPVELPGESEAGAAQDIRATIAAEPGAPEAIAAGTWVARLESPSIGLMATVLEGSEDAVLRRAAGHIPSTPLPGQTGNAGIAGHRDTTFRPLRQAKAGDTFRLTTADRVLTYVVSSTRIVDPTDVDVLAPTPRPALTLVTCYPFTFIGSAPKRFVVRADLIEARSR